jgi:cellulose synthase/poly-beta-1,6-N-acetylglucosamine synthase-like glycosyltransferase
MAVPSVSVVMSVFNGERFLREAVESILNQSFCDFEFIIINDGSTDDSGSILDWYQRSDHRIRTYHQENRGLVQSLNRGCGLAQGKYIARMDADDIAVRDRLTWQFTFMEDHPEVAVLGGAFELIDQTGEVLRVVRHPLEPRELERDILKSSIICHPTAFIRKAAVIAAGGYRNVVDAEDYDLWLRIAEHHPLANLPDVLLKYRLHLGQVSVARCRSQALGTVAARAAASARRSGKPDPLDSVGEITPALLARLGVSKTAQHTALARGYLSAIRNMCDAGEYTHALNVLEVLRSPELKHAEIWTIADLRLCAAKVYWHKRRFARSILAAAHAAITRPAILGRPFKPLLHRLTLLFQQLRLGGLIQSDTSV